MEFFMDENYALECAKDLELRFDDFKDLILIMEEITSNANMRLYYIHELYTFTTNEHQFSDALYSHYSDGQYRDEILRFDIAIERAHCTYGEKNRNLGSGIDEVIQVGIGGVLTTRDCSNLDGWDAEKMWTASNAETLKLTTRRLFTALNMAPESISTLASLMFPNIYFHANPSELGRMGLAYKSIAPDVMKHLEYLNDLATLHFQEILPDEIIRLAAASGVNISPESTKTRGKRKVMNMRNVPIASIDVMCEWHTKFSWDKGRIHFHARPDTHEEIVSKTVGSKVIVGIITKHLPI